MQQTSMNATAPMVAAHMHAITLLEVTSAPVGLVISLMWVVQNAHVSLLLHSCSYRRSTLVS